MCSFVMISPRASIGIPGGYEVIVSADIRDSERESWTGSHSDWKICLGVCDTIEGCAIHRGSLSLVMVWHGVVSYRCIPT